MRTNITLSADVDTVAKARAAALRQGTTLNALVRGYLQALAGEDSQRAAAEDLLRRLRDQPGRSGGYQFRREGAYDEHRR